MKKRPIVFDFIVILVLVPGILCFGAERLKTTNPSDVLVISGIITNPQGKGVKDCALIFYLNNK